MIRPDLCTPQARNTQGKTGKYDSSVSVVPVVAPHDSPSDQDSDDDDLILAPPITSDYRKTVFANTIATNTRYLALAANTSLPQSHRTMVVRWLFQVCDAMNLFDDTIFSATSMFDRITAQYNVEKCHLQLFGATCLWIAAKIEESVTPALSDFLYLCGDVYRDREFHECESVVLRTLNFSVAVSSPIFFLKGLLQRFSNERLSNAALFFARVSLFSIWYSTIQPHVIASASLFLGSLICHVRCSLASDDPRSSVDEMITTAKRILGAAIDFDCDRDISFYENFSREFPNPNFTELETLVTPENIDPFC